MVICIRCGYQRITRNERENSTVNLALELLVT